MLFHMDKLRDSVSWNYACSYATTYVCAAVKFEGLKELDHHKAYIPYVYAWKKSRESTKSVLTDGCNQ